MFLLTCSYKYRNLYIGLLLLLSLGDKYMGKSIIMMYGGEQQERILQRLYEIDNKPKDPYPKSNLPK